MFGAAIAVSRLQFRAAANCRNLQVVNTYKQCFSQEISQGKMQEFALSIRNFSNWRSLLYKKPIRKNDLAQGSTYRRMSLFRLKEKLPPEAVKPIETNPLKVNTNIKNNVMLYRFEKPYLYKGSILFAGAALIGCLAMADNVFIILCKELLNPAIPLMTRLYNHMLPLAFIGIGIIAGPAIFLTIWFITKQTIKYIVLHKGGKSVTMVMYHPLKGETTMTLPVNNISALSARTASKSYLPIRIKNMRFKYLVDKNGHFVNPDLFDVTVGIRRF